MRFTSNAIMILLLATITAVSPAAEEPGIHLAGLDFAGGAREQFGSDHFGQNHVNYVYAGPTGNQASMRAAFELETAPVQPMFLHLLARDHDDFGHCNIAISINDQALYQGPNTFPKNDWELQVLAIPHGVLKAGTNRLTITNLEKDGVAGTPPWFMVASCTISPCPAVPSPATIEDFFIDLPRHRRPLPEPLPEGVTSPGFRIRGTKGWNWTPEQYLAEIPVLARYKMNFLMNCYLSMFSSDHGDWNAGHANRWWEPLPLLKRRAYERVVRTCREYNIEFCFAMNPNLLSPRPLDYENAEDVDALWAHYHWMAGLKVNWFSICLDDISQGKDARGQAIVVNEILRRLREQNQQAQMVFCPTFYWGTGDETNARKYLETLATTLHPDVYLFWTGTSAVVPTISAETARHYKQRVKHRLIIWDNYPVNDSAPTLHLGPLTGRDPRLCDIADGYMANPLCPQNEINRIPLLTIADYAYNPMNYDPARSIGQSILHLAHTPGQQSVLRDLVELYPGMLLAGQGTAWNPVLFRFGQIVSQLHARHLADLYLHHVENVATRLERDFPDHFQAAGKTLRDNMIIMKELYMDHYVTKPAADKPPARRRPR